MGDLKLVCTATATIATATIATATATHTFYMQIIVFLITDIHARNTNGTKTRFALKGGALLL